MTPHEQILFETLKESSKFALPELKRTLNEIQYSPNDLENTGFLFPIAGCVFGAGMGAIFSMFSSVSSFQFYVLCIIYLLATIHLMYKTYTSILCQKINLGYMEAVLLGLLIPVSISIDLYVFGDQDLYSTMRKVEELDFLIFVFYEVSYGFLFDYFETFFPANTSPFGEISHFGKIHLVLIKAVLISHSVFWVSYMFNSTRSTFSKRLRVFLLGYQFQIRDGPRRSFQKIEIQSLIDRLENITKTVPEN